MAQIDLERHGFRPCRAFAGKKEGFAAANSRCEASMGSPSGRGAVLSTCGAPFSWLAELLPPGREKSDHALLEFSFAMQPSTSQLQASAIRTPPIPGFSLARQYESIKDEIHAAVDQVLG